MIGSTLRPYTHPYLALVGPNIPHNWSAMADRDNSEQVDFVIQFSHDEFNVLFKNFPEFKGIDALLYRGLSAIEFSAESIAEVKEHIIGMEKDSAPIKLIKLFEILLTLSKSKDATLLNVHSGDSEEHQKNNRIQKALTYINENFRNSPSLDEISLLINMNANAFCRKFKKETGLSYINFLNKVKIANATEMLINTDKSISQVGLECGFSNISNFNRRFIEINNITPSDFRRKLRVL